MAAVTTLDMTENVFTDFVTGLPPKPSHVIPKFHTRSNLFPSTVANKIYEEKNVFVKNRQVWSANPRLRQPAQPTENKECENIISVESGKKVKLNRRRPFSAKARLERSCKPVQQTSTLSKDDTDNLYNSNTCMTLVPVSGKEVPVVDIGSNAPFPSYHYQFNSKEKYVSEDVLPFLPGLAETRVPPLGLYDTTKDTQPTDDPSLKPKVHGLNSYQVLYGTTDAEGLAQDIKYDLTTQSVKKPERSLPATLEPLRPWLTEMASIPGINSADCLMFLPSISNYNDLPEVPPPHNIHDDLPYTSKLQQQHITTKKYHHPSFDKKHVEDWVCNHSRPGTSQRLDQERSRYRNYIPKYRTSRDIREEITELENLMQGLGNLDSDCGMVKFQGEIDRFRQMFEETMNMVPERLLHSPKDPDTFGVKELLRQHVDIMNEIRRKHTLCLEELRTLEAECGIESDRKYFKHRPAPPDPHD